jgi:alanine dehydrogenase
MPRGARRREGRAVILGIPRETKEGERRVALVPEAVAELTTAGHEVLVETRAGMGIGCTDDAYRDAGADIVTARDAWDCDLVVKVKEVQEADLAVMPKGATIFSFHHLPGEPGRTRALAERGVSAIAFEMVRDARGRYPLLAPMSEIAGRMAIGIGTRLLGCKPDRVVIVGAGHAGLAAAREAARTGTPTRLFTRTETSRRAAEELGFDARIADCAAVAHSVPDADLVIGAVFIPGAPTPKLLPRELVRSMRPGSVIVDISIDAGGVAETSHPTTHAEPSYVEEGVIHYCVPNIPALDPPAAAQAISRAVLPYVFDMSYAGVAAAVRDNPELRAGVLLWQGRVNHEGIAGEAQLPFHALVDSDLDA